MACVLTIIAACCGARCDWLQDKALVVCMYILEAHAQDEWPIRSGRANGGRGPVQITQPSTNKERMAVAR